MSGRRGSEVPRPIDSIFVILLKGKGNPKKVVPENRNNQKNILACYTFFELPVSGTTT